MKTYQSHNYTKNVITITPDTLATGANHCHNLLPTADNEFLSTMSSLDVCVEGNFEPFHYLQLDDGRLVALFLSGTMVYSLVFSSIKNQTTATPIKLVTTLDALPSCAVNSGNSVFLMMPEGAYRIDYDADNNRWTDLGFMPPLPPIEITATEHTDFAATIPSISLTGDYTHWQGTLNKNDLSTLSTHLLEAYSQLSLNAAAAGFFIQPVLARYHLLDDNGNVLFSSQPSMVSTPSGFQCIAPLNISTNDFATLNSVNLNATGYKIGVSAKSLNDSPWINIVASAVIEVTPLLDPIDSKATVQCRLDAIDATHGNLVVYMPGTSITMNPAEEYRRDMVKNAIASFESIASELALFPYPYSNGFATKALSPQSHFVKARHAATQPFTAMSALAMGDTILWGDLTSLRPSAPSLLSLCATTKRDSGFWRACVSVTFSSGNERMVWSGSGDDNCPQLINPLIAYPCSDANEISISISCGGSIVRESFPLTPLPGHNCAIYLHHSLKPFAITTATDMYIVPSQHTIVNPNSGRMAVSCLSAPFNLLASQQIGCGEIVAITPAVRSTSSWDFARTHAYAFTSTGTYAISVNAARSAISAHIIDNRHIINKYMVAFANNAVYAIASGDLISITGSRAATLRRNINATAIAWDNSKHLLWALGNTATARLLDFDRNIEVTCSVPYPALLFSADGLLLVSYGNDVKISNNTYAASTPVMWQHSAFIGSPQCRIIGVTLFISASHFDGTISLRAHGGAGIDNSYPITTLNINGAINSPIYLKIAAPHRPYINISIDANTSPDFTLHSVKLKINP